MGWRDEDDERREFAGVGLTVIGSIFNDTVKPVVLLRFANPDVGNRLSVSMVVPAQLTRVGGGGLSPVDFACGATAGRIGNSIFDTRFGRAGGLSDFGPVGGGGEFNVDLGWAQGGPASNMCTVQIKGRTPGTYTGVITATVAVL